MEIVGIDVGFGFTKAYNGKNAVIFKSLIGDATDIQFRSFLGEESSTANLHITLNDKSYFLGNYAEQQSNIAEFTLDQEKLIENFVKILAITAAGLCCETAGPINVVTGLPVGYLKRDSRRLKEMIQGIHEITFHNANGKDETKRIHIDKIHVIPQPIGSIFNLIFDEFGKIKDKNLATQKLGVVDIGFKTTDFSIFDHLQYIERGSST
ncbi:MAG: ParM/StbA family protein, partial [Proteobacteria bacterium]|nr:ParM/StbA family protein [Pseudomonadota bacterium]